MIPHDRPLPTTAALSDDARACLIDVEKRHPDMVAGLNALRRAAQQANDTVAAARWAREIHAALQVKRRAERTLAADRTANGLAAVPYASHAQAMPSPNDVQDWAVTVEVNGVAILIISDDGVSGIDTIAEFDDVVRGCAQHLLGMINHPANVPGAPHEVCADALDFVPDGPDTIAEMANLGNALCQRLACQLPDYVWHESPADVVDTLVNERWERAAAEAWRQASASYQSAWLAICQTLQTVAPDWHAGHGTGERKACAAILKLAERSSDTPVAQPAVTPALNPGIPSSATRELA